MLGLLDRETRRRAAHAQRVGAVFSHSTPSARSASSITLLSSDSSTPSRIVSPSASAASSSARSVMLFDREAAPTSARRRAGRSRNALSSRVGRYGCRASQSLRASRAVRTAEEPVAVARRDELLQPLDLPAIAPQFRRAA
jgi:hypothetical protein